MTSLVFAAVCIGLCALNAYLGFIQLPRLFRHHAQTGAIVFFLLALVSAYFGWREYQAIDELAELIEPVPEVADVLYVPTASEMKVMAKALAAAPGKGRAGTSQAERQQFATAVESVSTRYWRLDTTLSPGSVLDFYRNEKHRQDWEINAEFEPSLTLKRGSESLMIYTVRDRLRSITEVWYLHNQGSE